MSELEVIAATVGGIIALVVVLGFIAIKAGMVEGSLGLRIIPPKKRGLERAAEAAGDAVPLREAS